MPRWTNYNSGDFQERFLRNRGPRGTDFLTRGTEAPEDSELEEELEGAELEEELEEDVDSEDSLEEDPVIFALSRA